MRQAIAQSASLDVSIAWNAHRDGGAGLENVLTQVSTHRELHRNGAARVYHVDGRVINRPEEATERVGGSTPRHGYLHFLGGRGVVRVRERHGQRPGAGSQFSAATRSVA